jgi:hypothetical protein
VGTILASALTLLPWRRNRAEAQTGRDLRGEPAIRGPARAYYQRLTGDHSKVSSTGKLLLTATQLCFDSAIGTDVAVPLQDVVEVRDQKIRRFHVGGHDTQLVIATRSGEIGFLVADTAAWAAAVRVQLPPASESE